jgi:hypothetical protein
MSRAFISHEIIGPDHALAHFLLTAVDTDPGYLFEDQKTALFHIPVRSTNTRTDAFLVFVDVRKAHTSSPGRVLAAVVVGIIVIRARAAVEGPAGSTISDGIESCVEETRR